MSGQDIPEEDWGLAAMQRQLEAAEERQLSSWFGELESDTWTSLRRWAAPDRSNPLSRGILLEEMLTNPDRRSERTSSSPSNPLERWRSTRSSKLLNRLNKTNCTIPDRPLNL